MKMVMVIILQFLLDLIGGGTYYVADDNEIYKYDQTVLMHYGYRVVCTHVDSLSNPNNIYQQYLDSLNPEVDPSNETTTSYTYSLSLDSIKRLLNFNEFEKK